MLDFLEKLWLFSGGVIGFSGLMMMHARKSAKAKGEEGGELWAMIVGFGVLVGFAFPVTRALGHDEPEIFLLAFVVQIAAGFIGAIWLMRRLPAMRDGMTARFGRRTVAERNKRTDVREISEHLPEAGKPFDPERYFNKKKGVFVGLDESGQPVYLSREQFPTMPHIQALGTSGAGKGVFLGVLASQWLRDGEAVFMLDPKDDEWAPHVFADAAESAGVAHAFINLRVDQPQFSLFEGASAADVEELLIAGFSLADRGEAADFYNIADRKYAGIVARAIAADGLTAAQAYNRFAGELEDKAPKFGGKLRELGEVMACNAPAGHGVSLAEVIEEGGSCYFVGHMRAEKIVRVQKMILVRLLQIAEKRDRISGKLRSVGIILDELKYHLSKTALEALGAARDKGVHMVLAHQSIGDLTDVDGTMNGDAVVDAVVENCGVKVGYKVKSPETAEWFGRMSGKILVDDESRKAHMNFALAESVSGERTISQAERFFVDENMLLNLPKGVAVVYGLALPKFAHVCPVKAEKDAKNIAVNAVKQDETLQEIEAIKKPEELI